MQADRSVDVRWWLTRVAIYFVVWTCADMLAYWLRFSQAPGQGFLVAWGVASVWKLALLLWFIPRQTDRSDMRGVLLSVGVGLMGLVFVGFWSKADVSRAWVGMDAFLSAGALTVASMVMHRVRPQGSPPPTRPDR